MQAAVTRRAFVGGAVAAGAVCGVAGALGGVARADEAPQGEAAQGEATSAQGESSEGQQGAASVPAWTQMNPQAEDTFAATTEYAELFTPIQVGHMTLKNRICKAAAGSDTLPRDSTEMSQNALDYYGAMADGGAALIVLEDSTVKNFGVNPFGEPATGDMESSLAEAKKIVDRVHEGGAYVGYQIGIGSPLDSGDVNAYTLDEIHEMVTGFGEAAARAKGIGFDCVEIKGATTDGLNQFVTRRINAREDECGAQTEENRVRFFSEIIAEIRAQCGDDFSILALINAVEENDSALGDNDGCIVVEESKYLASALEAAGADLIQVRVGAIGQEANCWATDTNHCAYQAHGTTGYGTQFDYASHWEGLMDGSHQGAGAFIPMAAAIKEAVSVPVGCASYMDPNMTPDLINGALAAGQVDLVFMNRPLTVDPELPNKLAEGRRDEVAPCCRCFHCHGKPYGEAECCRVNPTTQYAYTDEFPEGYALTPAETPKNVLVVGGGVAGLEAAMTAAQRGHVVTLCERNSYLGGMLLFAEQVKGEHENLGALLAYLERQCELAGVTVMLDTEVTADVVAEMAPDAVIVACGGARESRYPDALGMDAFVGAEIGENVVILGANLQATDVAQYLIAQGRRVTLVNEKTAEDVDAEQSRWVRTYVRAHLYAHGVKCWNEASVVEVRDGEVEVTLKSGATKVLPADTVIECFDMVADTTLLDELTAAGYEAYAAGCDAPRNIQSAIHAGYKVARYL